MPATRASLTNPPPNTPTPPQPRALSQLLLVLSDDDLHTRGAPFNTGAARAIATTLNALVYHTHFPKQQQQVMRREGSTRLSTGGGAAAAPLPPATLRSGADLLERYAPPALRGLYERDQRRPFCQPALWTAPFDGDAAQGGGGGAAASQQQAPQHSGLRAVAAVVQGLLLGGGSAAGGSGAAAAGAQGSAPARLAPVTTSNPSAMTALLRVAPQCVPFDVRLELFRQILAEDKSRGRWDLSPAEGGPRPLKLTVRRATLLEDAFAALAGRGDALKGRLYVSRGLVGVLSPLTAVGAGTIPGGRHDIPSPHPPPPPHQVSFVNEHGLAESGIDSGGLTKELLWSALTAALQPGYGLFEVAPGSGLAFPSPAAEAIPQGLALLEFTGLLVGKALYEGILVDLALAPPLVMALQGARPGVDDLAGEGPGRDGWGLA
jgi:hypothetical protein